MNKTVFRSLMLIAASALIFTFFSDNKYGAFPRNDANKAEPGTMVRTAEDTQPYYLEANGYIIDGAIKAQTVYRTR